MKIHSEDKAYLIISIIGAIMIFFTCSASAQELQLIRCLNSYGEPVLEESFKYHEFDFVDHPQTITQATDAWNSFKWEDKMSLLHHCLEDIGFEVVRYVELPQQMSYFEAVPAHDTAELTQLAREGMIFKVQLYENAVKINYTLHSPINALLGLHNHLVSNGATEDEILWK